MNWNWNIWQLGHYKSMHDQEQNQYSSEFLVLDITDNSVSLEFNKAECC